MVRLLGGKTRAVSPLRTNALARGAAAGLAGGAVMTAFQTLVEMPLTRRGTSYAPANLVERLFGVRPRGRARDRLNWVAHVGVGAGWGAGQAALAERTGLRGQRAVGAAFGLLYAGDVVANTALGLYAPREWSARDWAIDVTNKLVLAQAVGAADDVLRGRRGAPASA